MVSFSAVATTFSFYGTVSFHGNNTPTGFPVTVFVNGVNTKTVNVGGVGNTNNNEYSMAFAGNIGETAYFQVYGANVTQAETTLTAGDYSSGRNLDLTANKSAASAACRYSLGCLGGYCCSGGTEYTDGSGTGACQATACAAASTTTTTSGGGGGGGGGGAVSTTTATTQTITTGRVNAGQTATATFTASNIVVTDVQITVKKAVTASSVTAVNQGSSRGIATVAVTSEESAADMAVYSYLKITVSKISNTNMEKAVIKFKVKKAAGYDPATIELRRYDGVYRTWSPLTTTLVLQDSMFYYYEAETPGFSIFAIVGKKVAITMMQLLDTVRSFYEGTSPYTMMEILDQIRIFYGG